MAAADQFQFSILNEALCATGPAIDCLLSQYALPQHPLSESANKASSVNDDIVINNCVDNCDKDATATTFIAVVVVVTAEELHAACSSTPSCRLLRAFSACARIAPLNVAQYDDGTLLFWPFVQRIRQQNSLPRMTFMARPTTGVPPNTGNSIPAKLEYVTALDMVTAEEEEEKEAEVRGTSLLRGARAQLRFPQLLQGVLADVQDIARLLAGNSKFPSAIRRDARETFLVARARTGAALPELLRMAEDFANEWPLHAPAVLHRATARLSMGDAQSASHDAWCVVLGLARDGAGADWEARHIDNNVMPRESPYIAKARALLARCAFILPYVGLDVVLLPTESTPLPPPMQLVWSNLSREQRAAHAALMGDVMRDGHAQAQTTNNLHPYAWVLDGQEIKLCPLPRAFWVCVPGRLAACSPLTSADQIEALRAVGVTLVVVLCNHQASHSSWFNDDTHGPVKPISMSSLNKGREQCRTVRFTLLEKTTPSIAQYDAFLVEAAAARMTVVHAALSAAGRHSLLAVWFLAYGEPPQDVKLCHRCAATLLYDMREQLFIGCCNDGACALAPCTPQLTATQALEAAQARCVMASTSCNTDITTAQRRSVAEYAKELWRRYGLTRNAAPSDNRLALVYPALASNEFTHEANEPHELQVQGRPFQRVPPLIVLCGAPGSGKSTLASGIAHALGSTHVSIVSRDELGSSSACDAAVVAAVRAGVIAIVDRCNPTAAKRAHWFHVTFCPDDAIVVFVDTSQARCVVRAQRRVDHPTLRAKAAPGVVRAFFNTLQRPGEADLREGFCAVYTICGSFSEQKFLNNLKRLAETQSNQDISLRHAGLPTLVENVLPKTYVIDINGKKPIEHLAINHRRRMQEPKTKRLKLFHKFPRTRHLMDLGDAVTPDDIVMSDEQRADILAFLRSSSEINKSRMLTIEEKLDGANIGFCIDDSNGEIVAQNRSHFVNSKSHAQFKLLRYFIDTHEQDLRRLLRRGGRVLFGEWMYARHSVKYTRLPSIFLAFDIFDIEHGKFLSRARFRVEMEATQLERVPEIANTLNEINEETLAGLTVNQRSAYSEEPAEGIYLRLDEGDWLLDRAKIVRPGFIVGNQHWTRRKPEKNSFAGV